MPIDIEDLFDILSELCEKRELKAAVKGSIKGGILTGISAATGGLLLGPLGLFIGGAIGGGVSALTDNSFRPVPLILRDMTAVQKRRLYGKVMHAFRNFGVNDAVNLAALVMSNKALQEVAVNEVINYLTQQMSLKIK